MKGLVCALALAGCARRPCAAANEARADHEQVSGATVDGLVAALAAQPWAPVPVVWRDGAETSATASIEIVPGTGARVQRPDCLPECHTRYELMMQCGPDTLYVEARGTASTADGRVVDARWTGRIGATALHGPLGWSVTSEPIPVAELAGDLEPSEVAQVREGARNLGLRVNLSGRDGALTRVSFDVSYDRGEGELASHGVAGLGSTPRPEPVGAPPAPEPARAPPAPTD